MNRVYEVLRALATHCPYAVGDLYITTSSNYDTVAKVQARWSGTTWEKVEGRYLFAADSGHAANGMGGSGTSGSTAITVDQMPSHTHAWSRRATSSTARGEGLTGAYSTEYSQDTGAIKNTGGGKGHTHSVTPLWYGAYIYRRIG